MKPLCWLVGLLVVLGLSGCSERGLPGAATLSDVADRAVAEGKDATMNVGFARFLGLAADQPLALKRLQFEEDGATNIFNVLVNDPNTIVLMKRRDFLGWFYLADRSGALKRAVVNDSAIADGGLTNLTAVEAAADFEALKRSWLQRPVP